MNLFIFIFLSLFLIGFYLLSPLDFVQGTKNGLLLWAKQLLPVLLPFTILSSLIVQTNLLQLIKTRFPSRRKITPTEVIVILIGLLFGFPVGAKIISELYLKGELTKQRAQILCGFANQFSIIFLTGYVSTLLSLSQTETKKFLFYILLPPIVIGTIRLIKKPNYQITHKKSASRFQVNMQIVDAGIMSGFEVLMKLCGYITFFAIASSFLSKQALLPNLVKGIFVGLLETTNGIKWLQDSNLCNENKLLFATLFVSLGGVSGLVQTKAILAKTNLSTYKYLSDKLIYTFLSVSLCILNNCVAKI